MSLFFFIDFNVVVVLVVVVIIIIIINVFILMSHIIFPPNLEKDWMAWTSPKECRQWRKQSDRITDIATYILIRPG